MAKHYTCAKCNGIFPLKSVEVNHKVPVIPVTGFDNWTNVIERMFCEKEHFEVLCKPCHKAQTQLENKVRKSNVEK